jgi:hypothetical protein
METILSFLKPIAEIIAMKVPALSMYSAQGIAALIAVGLLVEIFELIASYTASKADDELAVKIKKIREKVLAVLEIIPHANIPVASFIMKATKFLAKVLKIGKAASDAAK